MRRFFNRVRETCTATGTGNITLTGAVPGYLSFLPVYDSLGGGDTFTACIVDLETNEWEIFESNSMPDQTTIVRWSTSGAPTASTNDGSMVEFQAGTAKEVFVVLSAEDIYGRTYMQHVGFTSFPAPVPPNTYSEIVVDASVCQSVSLYVFNAYPIHMSIMAPEGVSGKTISIMVHHDEDDFPVTLVDDNGSGFKSAGGTITTGSVLPSSGNGTADVFQFTYLDNVWVLTGTFMNVS